MVTPAAEREAVAHLRSAFEMGVQGYQLLFYDSRHAATRADDGTLRQEMMKAIAHERHRFGYRGLHVPLRRKGYVVNHKRLFRLYREERLTVRRRSGRKRAIGASADVDPSGAERALLARFCLELIDGRRLRILGCRR